MENNKQPQLAIRLLLIFGGLIFTGVGILGIFLPLLPTTVFLIIAAFLFTHSSEKLKHWLYHNRVTAPTMKLIAEKKGMTLKSKLVILIFAWTMLILGAVFSKGLFVKILLPSLGVIKTIIFVFVIKTYHPTEVATVKEEAEL